MGPLGIRTNRYRAGRAHGRPGREPNAHSAWKVFSSLPIPSISTTQVLPGASRIGGLRTKPTPPGVPVTITSPGLNATKFEQ